MEISDVRVYLRNENKLKAFVTVTFNKVLVVHNMKIIQGQKGLLLCMPSRKGPDGKFRDVVHPITNDFRHALEQKVFGAYEDEVKKLSQGMRSNLADGNQGNAEEPQHVSQAGT
ncbi:MAG: septation protein SpoVG family protein [Elusimicrobia bacterium]|nr:septation protein SpoVG family protein [Elusimicrobiota bacterium]